MLDHVYREETHSISASEGVKGSQSGRRRERERAKCVLFTCRLGQKGVNHIIEYASHI